jgi:hypothetical protein
MRRICFVGNSHVGAVKQAVDNLKGSIALDGVEISIFGSHSNSLKTAKVNEDTIFSDDIFVQNNFYWTSSGLTEVKISNYDEICFLIGTSIFDSSHFQAGSDIPFISRALAEEIMTNALDSWPLRLAKNTARENKNVKVTHIGIPFSSAKNPKVEPLLAKLRDSRSSFSIRLKKLKVLIEKKAAEASEGNFRIMKPPPAALEDSGLFTQHIFCQGSTRLSAKMDVAHPPDDYDHMNAAYGKLLLEYLLT